MTSFAHAFEKSVAVSKLILLMRLPLAHPRIVKLKLELVSELLTLQGHDRWVVKLVGLLTGFCPRLRGRRRL